jgi:alpha-tubulin suppressor-like RCC1 family protein
MQFGSPGALGRARVVPAGVVAAPARALCLLVMVSCGADPTGPASLITYSLEVSPATLRLAPRESGQVVATVTGSDGRVSGTARVTWVSGDSAVAKVGHSGLVTAVAAGSTQIVAIIGDDADTVQVDVVITFRHVSAGGAHTCGLTTDGEIYCWGSSRYGVLGTGSIAEARAPVRTAGDVAFATVSAGDDHTCAISAEGAAFCWGYNTRGDLGTGTTDHALVPTRVVGDLRFATITAGNSMTCALTEEGRAYCWGSNVLGQLGIGLLQPAQSTAPVAVATPLTFTSISAGEDSGVCAISLDGVAHCWGRNDFHQLGREPPNVFMPDVGPVSGGTLFRTLEVGYLHSCGLALDGKAYCWGYGLLGDGRDLVEEPAPVAVAGGYTFTEIVIGTSHSCALTPGGDAYCWGRNETGAGGSPPSSGSLKVPTLVQGGLKFASLSAGGDHTCGVTIDQLVYCWGGNGYGQLGDGGTVPSAAPVRVLFQR